MPKELNIEKLERKFSFLTKSRESIQAVSSWIMHHHEFCEEIVEQWYISLTKDQNALVMFYVANEIIQNCGKKKVPQYREAFSKVLEKAVSLEKVKEIKADVCRILCLWKERSIYDDQFFQRLETKINEIEVTSSPSTEEEELSELEIITKYKSENLFDSLKRLKVVEAEVKEKEEVLNFTDVPVLHELSNLTEQNECLEILQKLYSYHSLVNEYLKATINEIKARRKVVKELKYSCIFYTAQQKDVKKVANAYMTYGKRLKNTETKLSEKILVLPSPIENYSPSFSDTCASPIASISPFDNDTRSVSGSSTKMSPSSGNEREQDTIFSHDYSKNDALFWSKISKKASSDFTKNFEMGSEEITENRQEESYKQKFSKLTELFAGTKPDSENKIKPKLANIDSLNETSNLKCFNSPNKLNEIISDLEIVANQQIKILEKIDPNSREKCSNQETSILNNLTEEISKEKEKTVSTEKDYEVDHLLDKSYDKKKSSINIKRKIELLLQSKGKKICTVASKEKSSDSILPSNTYVEGKNSSDASIKKDSIKLNNPGNTRIKLNEIQVCTNSKATVPILSPSSKKVEKTPSDSISENVKSGIKKKLPLEEKIKNFSNVSVPSSSAIEQHKEMKYLNERNGTQDSLSNNNDETSRKENTNNNSNINIEINVGSESSKISEVDNFSIQTPSPFLGSSLLSSVSSESTEFLKNILGKNKSSPSPNALNKHVTDTCSVKDSKETYKFPESEGSENMIKNPTLNYQHSLPTTEEKLLQFSITTKPVSQNESPEKDIKNEIKAKEISKTNTDFLDNTSIKSKDLEQSTSNCNKKMELSNVDIQLKSMDQLETERADDKPNLLLTLQNILECISNKNISICDSKNVSVKPMPFETCLNMYYALRSADSSKNVDPSKITSAFTSIDHNQDNFEVMDMECDSD